MVIREKPVGNVQNDMTISFEKRYSMEQTKTVPPGFLGDNGDGIEDVSQLDQQEGAGDSGEQKRNAIINIGRQRSPRSHVDDRPTQTLARSLTKDEYAPPFRVRDTQLIIVGRGPDVWKLLQARVDLGGRACVLWTGQFPTQIVHTDSSTSIRATPDETMQLFETFNDSRMLFSSFVWLPPAHHQALNDPEFKKYCKQFQQSYLSKTTFTSFCRVGPDLVELGEGQEYHILVHEGKPSGVRVVKDGAMSWQMSGGVEFVGIGFSQKELRDEEVAERVAVHDEEAKPFALFFPEEYLTSCAFIFIVLLLLFFIMCKVECDRVPGSVPYWRGLCLGSVAAIFGAGTVPDIWGVGLTGVPASRSSRWIGAVVATFGMSFFAILPIGDLDDNGSQYEWPLFVVCTLGTALYAAIAIPIHAIQAWEPAQRKLRERGKKFYYKAHILWLLCLNFLTLGIWILCYIIAIIFINLGKINPTIASWFLSFATLIVELLCELMIIYLYDWFIYMPRESVSINQHECLGDHRSYICVPFALAHSFAGGTQLASVIAQAIVMGDDTHGWIQAGLSCFLINASSRSGLFRQVLSRIEELPCLVRWQGWLPLPGASLVWRSELKFLFGYSRVLSIAAFILGRWMAGVTYPVWTTNAAHAFLFMVLMECLEDVVVRMRTGKRQTWLRVSEHRYEEFMVHDIKQLLAKDRSGVHWESPSLSLHGVRSIKFLATFAASVPSFYFTPFLLNLLLGSGYSFGCCNEREYPDRDSYAWSVPLSCE